MCLYCGISRYISERLSYLTSTKFTCSQGKTENLFSYLLSTKMLLWDTFLSFSAQQKQDRTVSTATRLWVAQSWVQFPTAVARNFSPLQSIKTSSRSHLASYAMGTRDLKLGVKQPGCEADHSPPPSATVKQCSNTSGPSMYCHGMQKTYFTFTSVY